MFVNSIIIVVCGCIQACVWPSTLLHLNIWMAGEILNLMFKIQVSTNCNFSFYAKNLLRFSHIYSERGKSDRKSKSQHDLNFGLHNIRVCPCFIQQYRLYFRKRGGTWRLSICLLMNTYRMVSMNMGIWFFATYFISLIFISSHFFGYIVYFYN